MGMYTIISRKTSWMLSLSSFPFVCSHSLRCSSALCVISGVQGGVTSLAVVDNNE